MENNEKYNLEEYVDYVVKGYCDFEDEGGEYINLEDVSYKGLDYLYVKAKDGEKPAVYCCEKDDTGGHFALFDSLEKSLQEIIIEQISKKAKN